MNHRIAVLLLPGALPLDVGIPLQIFGLDPHYDLTVCADPRPGPTPVAGLLVTGTEPFEALLSADTVIVPGVENPVAPLSGETLAALRAAAGRGTRMVSICTGVFALASAGLLTGRTVTTHWQEADRLQGMYPDVHVDPRPLFIDDGDVLSSAGVTAGIDLCLHLIASDFGAGAANDRARAIVAAPRRTGDQAQFIAPRAHPTAGLRLAPLRAWMAENPTLRHTIVDLAARVPCAPRTLARTFVAETGLTPAAWMTTIRVDRARELLETTDLPIEALGEWTGLGSPAATRAAFRRMCGVSPEQYRRTFLTGRTGQSTSSTSSTSTST